MESRSFHPLLLFCMILILMPDTAYGAMDPEEVEGIKREAPLHVIGSVESDVLVKDLSTDNSPKQLRKMRLSVQEYRKAPGTINRERSIEVFYTYIPSWVAMAGGSKMDIYEGDEIELWLDKGEYGWEPAAAGNTVEHLSYVEDRKEPIPEPKTHAAKETFNENLGVLVMGGFVIALLFFIFLSRRWVTPKERR
ncbi:hypothetical protein [Halobacillus aidingensis]|uniref:Uncharacterized protein n=1 Tax=Halobacillus aidingensis TaxID=240303 RepID=A0A1H0FPW2_HALAD|nr:hypothetical protein [Halobacillus aidingensis]SDN96644.1 hypothetical protein SAMN05421677_10274 [Halobacillus aidingensis]